MDSKRMLSTENGRIAIVAVIVLVLDQLTKQLVNRLLPMETDEKILIPGFFKFVHWGNTGAAWSLFSGNNGFLAIVALIALFILFRSRHHFDAHTLMGQIALGLIFGGIIGNLTDRLRVGHVTDFLYFHLQRRGGPDIGFPAFNIADSAICIGVGLIFILSLRSEKTPIASTS
ncbi:MAG TPA: signal peptidase II [Verrucomicrobiae bacterium]|jgi:signal peptidase II|nr:signal peptidase II [Verrucomicrobiae bacterium]